MNSNPPDSMGSIPPSGPHSGRDRSTMLSGAMPAYVRPTELGFVRRQMGRAVNLVEDLGTVGLLTARCVRVLFKPPLEWRAVIYQMEKLGVASVGIASVTAVFIGMVMALQVAIGLQKFGGLEYVGRVVGLSFARELAPSLTAVIVGGRIGAGMAAEVGSMNVTEQVDAIRALGADPVKKLVMPRVLASIIIMPILAFFALVLGFVGAMVVIASQFSVPMRFFYQSAIETITMKDLLAGMGKTPFFGFIISIIGCHFGLKTTGGTEGVGRSTTATVVAVSITILSADVFLTTLFMAS
ncbi:MAG: MlaE family lipid ABC transporter permease subunit [Polyangiales bacterium]